MPIPCDAVSLAGRAVFGRGEGLCCESCFCIELALNAIRLALVLISQIRKAPIIAERTSAWPCSVGGTSCSDMGTAWSARNSADSTRRLSIFPLNTHQPDRTEFRKACSVARTCHVPRVLVSRGRGSPTYPALAAHHDIAAHHNIATHQQLLSTHALLPNEPPTLAHGVKYRRWS
jgi:hypothetical protein